jgi:hypothetical protein
MRDKECPDGYKEESYSGACLKKVKWDNPNKMHMSSGYKEFDKQTNFIDTGNVIADTQNSFYIRAHNTPTNPVGDSVAPGAMQKWDLDSWFQQLPGHIRQEVEEKTVDKDNILYNFFILEGDRRIDLGYVLTDRKRKLIKKWYTNGENARMAVDEAMKYVTDYDSWVRK